MTTPPRKLLIVGGGTAGWMAALHFKHIWADRAIDITLIESARIGTVGVGEGTTPLIKDFFDRLGIPESEWMPACSATYKCGISFPDWSTVQGYESYFHPFFSEHDRAHVNHFWDNCNLRRDGYDIMAHPDDYFVSTAMVRQHRAPISKQPNVPDAVYGYHFDAALMGQYFKTKAMALGVNFIEDTIASVNRAKDGDIRSVVTEEHGEVEADFFIDCTGFRGLLIRGALGEELVSMGDYMFNDSAVAIPTPREDNGGLSSETISKALSHGWCWHIPLVSRMGNGYVFSSKYYDHERAEAEFRAYLGDKAEGAEAVHLRWEPGRLENHWQRNCVAIGLSQGFLEPLEALMINVIQRSVEGFAESWEAGNFTNQWQDRFNGFVNRFIDGIRDYLQLHYKLNTRTDSQYWIDNRENEHLSDHLRTILDAWDTGKDFDRVLYDHINQQVYPRTSWYCMLAGMGRFPTADKQPMRIPQRRRERAAQASLQQAEAFWPHDEYLEQIYQEHGS
ncbi:MAG: tryptophan halogenase family protein [Pseudomonadota bacterium]